MKLDLAKRGTIERLDWPADGKAPIDYPVVGQRFLVLTLRASRLGTRSRSWTLRYRIGHGETRRQCRFTLGQYPDMSADQACEAASRARQLIRAGIDPADRQAEECRAETLKRERAAERSYERIAERYIHTQRKRDRRSWADTARVLGFGVSFVDGEDQPVLTFIPGGLAHRWKGRELSLIQRIDVTAAVDELTDRDRPEAARKRLNTLKTFFGYAANAGYIERSPIERYKFDRPKPSRDRVLSDDELRLVWRAAACAGYPTEQFIRLLILTGQRRLEVAGIAHAEIAGDVWELPASRSKNKHAHRVPLSPMAAEIIASAPRYMSGAILTTNGRRAISGFSVIKRHLDARVTKLNGGTPLPEWHLHDLRRSVASGMAAIGIPPHVIEQVLNHRSAISGVAAVYNRYSYDAEKREALQRWADHVAKIVSAEPKTNSEPSKIVALRTA